MNRSWLWSLVLLVGCSSPPPPSPTWDASAERVERHRATYCKHTFPFAEGRQFCSTVELPKATLRRWTKQWNQAIKLFPAFLQSQHLAKSKTPIRPNPAMVLYYAPWKELHAAGLLAEHEHTIDAAKTIHDSSEMWLSDALVPDTIVHELGHELYHQYLRSNDPAYYDALPAGKSEQIAQAFAVYYQHQLGGFQ